MTSIVPQFYGIDICHRVWMILAPGLIVPRERLRKTPAKAILANNTMIKAILLLVPAVVAAQAQTGYLSGIRQLTHGGQNAQGYLVAGGTGALFPHNPPRL